MAFGANELYTTGTGSGSSPRAWATAVGQKALAAGSGTIARLTPMALNTSTHFWTPFQSGGLNGVGTIGGFLWPNDAVLDAANQTLGVIMLRGEIHIDDIPIIAGYTLAQLKTAINASSLRQKGILIRGWIPVLGTDDGQI